MADSDLMFRPALELAEMVRCGEVSASELAEISLERIEERNPTINAFVTGSGTAVMSRFQLTSRL